MGRHGGALADTSPPAADRRVPTLSIHRGRVDRDLAYLHVQVFSIRRASEKLEYLAGSESAMGAFVNDVIPEAAARMLREVTP